MRRLDVLTLGLSAPSRWNPLYRRWARRAVEAQLAAGLKALLAERGGSVHLSRATLAEAAARGAIAEPAEDGVLFRIVREPAPRRIGVLWDYPDG